MIATDNATLRDKFVHIARPLTKAQLIDEVGRVEADPEVKVEQWRKANDIFAVDYHGVEVFPALQFHGGRPHPTIRKVLAVLPETMSPWQRAIWFVSTNGWLNDKAPAECLEEPDAVVAAASHEALEVIG